MLKRGFWHFNSSIGGILIGWGLFYSINTSDKKLGLILLAIGVSQLTVSILGYRKFVGKGFWFRNRGMN
jgi:hypothetical protein